MVCGVSVVGKSIEDQIRDGVVTECGDVRYKTLFVGGNFYVYRHVSPGIGYRGHLYTESGYVLAWADCSEIPDRHMPSFVGRCCK